MPKYCKEDLELESQQHEWATDLLLKRLKDLCPEHDVPGIDDFNSAKKENQS